MTELDIFKNVLNYSTCNEDSLTELKALNISKTDSVLCITGSGGRVLNLLVDNPKKIIAIDFNPTQNWLLELKMAAIRNLNYNEYSNFLGLSECRERINIFERIKKDLSHDAHTYWSKNLRSISRGILYQGQFEKKCKYLSNVLKEALGDKIDKVFSLNSLEEQRDLYSREWDNSVWENNVDLRIYKDIDPAFYLYVNTDYNMDSYVSKMLDKGFNSHLVKDNHLLCMLVDGGYKRASKLPICLQEENYDVMKRNLDNIEIVTGNIVEYIEKLPPKIFNKFSISDVTGYLSENDSDKLYNNIVKIAANKSRICARSLLSKREIPVELDKIITREIQLEEELESKDLALSYKILVASISCEA